MFPSQVIDQDSLVVLKGYKTAASTSGSMFARPDQLAQKRAYKSQVVFPSPSYTKFYTTLSIILGNNQADICAVIAAS